jgi:hypothetical protein
LEVRVAEQIPDSVSGPWTDDPMIPGGRDPSNLTHREPGAVGGQFSGDDIPDAASPWLDEATAREHDHEGGGHR